MVALVPSVSGHCVFLSAQGLTTTGAQGGPVGQALAVNPSTPRNGQSVEVHQVDVTLFKERTSLKLWQTCGSSIQGGYHKADLLIPKLFEKGQVAQAMAGGQMMMILHQINGDGNGPFTCAIDSTALAKKGSWKEELDIYTQVPGNNPVANAVLTTQFPLIVNIPEDVKCTGKFETSTGLKKTKVCLMRCQNNATNGPFGGCIPFELVKSLRANFKRQAPPMRGTKYKRQDPPPKADQVPEVTGNEPAVAKPPSPEEILAMMKKIVPAEVNKNPTNLNEKREEPAAAAVAKTTVNADDVVTALTEGDPMTDEEKAALKEEVKKEMTEGTLPPRTKERSKEHKVRKTRTKGRRRPVKVPEAAPPERRSLNI
ncbi:hypothetical protein ABW20_dc0102077 [Dactylellina cionopaga]|nr:hypothetical protein ABW20_dc0102077 [Dactylellina cionopaga]